MDFGCDCACLGVGANQTLDRVLCGAVEHVLRRTTSFGERRFLKLLQLDDGSSVSEHVYREGHSKPLHDFEIEKFGLVILGVGALIIRTCGTCAWRCRSIRATF